MPEIEELLTDKELKLIDGKLFSESSSGYDFEHRLQQATAKAQNLKTLRAVVKWGNEPCRHEYPATIKKRECNQCWAELERLVEEK
jgi:hypothetical protein